LDFALPDEPPPAGFAETSVRQLLSDVGGGGLTLLDPETMTVEQRWRWYREQKVLKNLADVAGIADVIWGSVQMLKDALDREIRDATLLFTTVPSVALLVAALGVGNLMMANVNSRARQIAVLRAVGATQWQIMRLVLAEALVLGVLGSAVGVALGIHMAHSIQEVTFKIWTFQPTWTIPWSKVVAGSALTTGICLVAGALPARHAARSNIAGALQTT
jgi:ABC-type antimicrobial peptide transport system permease subunit